MAQSRGDADAARGGYGLLVLLTLMNVLNFVDRQLLSSFANFIVPDLNLTNTEFGLLTGLVFIAFYAVAGVFMGALGDMVLFAPENDPFLANWDTSPPRIATTIVAGRVVYDATDHGPAPISSPITSPITSPNPGQDFSHAPR